MSRPAALLRTAMRPAARPALSIPRAFLLARRAPYSTKKPRQKMTIQLPPEAAFEEASQKAGFKEANPNLYYRCITEWLGALQREQTHDMGLLKRINATPQDFHEAAIFYLQYLPPPPNTPLGRRRAVALSMLLHASEHGHDASTLTYLNNELEHIAMGLKTASITGPILSRLDAIASTNLSPDAITLQGRLAALSSDHKAATILFRRAIELGKSNPELQFTWRASTLVHLGKSLRQQNDTAGARACFEEAANKYNLTRAWLELTYDGECPEEVERSALAAMRGNREECVRISGAESEVAVRALERGDKVRFTDHQYISQEWLRLANTRSEEDLGKTTGGV